MNTLIKASIALIATPLLALASPKTESTNIGVSVSFSKDTNELVVKGEMRASEFVARSVIGTRCEDSETLYFKIGRQNFLAPTRNFERQRSIPNNLRFSADKSSAQVEWMVPANLGCKENPASYATVEIKTKTATTISLTESEDSNGVSRYIAFLNQNKMCQTTKFPQVIACSGSRTENNAKVFLIFMLPINAGGGLYIEESGIPVHARCEATSPPDFSCTVNAYFKQSFKATVAIPSDALSRDSIIHSNKMLTTEVQQLIVD